ncbi:hypothetical protein [Streptomyces roseus]|nr:hypothetical protein [Streptomyces roseus]
MTSPGGPDVRLVPERERGSSVEGPVTYLRGHEALYRHLGAPGC